METVDPPFEDAKVAAVFASFPASARVGLYSLRKLVFDTAETTDGVGRLHETLKWGQPAYLTPETGAGTTIRLGVPRQGGFAIYTHCQTQVIPQFRSLFPNEFDFDANRGVRFSNSAVLPLDLLRLLFASALTYHLR